jgi:hypothetical protein
MTKEIMGIVGKISSTQIRLVLMHNDYMPNVILVIKEPFSIGVAMSDLGL